VKQTDEQREIVREEHREMRREEGREKRCPVPTLHDTPRFFTP
jgi:hypothetical protein